MKRGLFKFIFFASISALLIMGCQNKNGDADAFGVIEAREITISSESNGKLLTFEVDEGNFYQQGEILGIIDTTQLYLQILQLNASINAALAKRPDMPAQIKALQDKLETLQKEQIRIKNLIVANAVSTQKLDEINVLNISNQFVKISL